MQIYRINKETDEWLKKAYDYVRTDAFCFGQNIPVELEFAGEEAQDDLEDLINDTDNLFICGDKKNICISAKDIVCSGRTAIGTSVIKNEKIKKVTKI